MKHSIVISFYLPVPGFVFKLSNIIFFIALEIGIREYNTMCMILYVRERDTPLIL